MSPKQILSLTLVCLLLVVVGCKKSGPQYEFCTELSAECVDVRGVKDYFYFDYGSWWVYEEENSGKRDSVYVKQTYNDTGSYYFTTELFSTYDGYDYHFWANGAIHDADADNIVPKNKRSTSVKRSKTKPGDFVGEALCFIYYPRVGLKLATSGGGNMIKNKIEVDSVFETYMFRGNDYTDVVLIGEEHTAIEESQPTRHYYAKGVGLIKKELLDSNQVWNLVNYHIIQ